MKIIVNKSYLSITQGSNILPKLVCMVLLLISSPIPACGSDPAGPSTSQDPDLRTNELEGSPKYNVDINAMIKEAVSDAEALIAQQEEDSQQPSTEEVVRPEEGRNAPQKAGSQQPSTEEVVRPEEGRNAQQDAGSQQPSTARQEEGRNAPQDAGSQQYSTLDLKNQSGSSSSVNTQEKASGS